MKKLSLRLSLGVLALAVVALLAYWQSRAQAVTWSLASGAPNTFVSQSATGAAAIQTATLPAVAARLNYIEGFDVTGGGATAASVITITVTGTTNTLNYTITVPAGATGAITPFSIRFPSPMPASAVNTAINVIVPSFGAGNTAASVSVYGFTQ
jgi:hypothetical protein